jgi:hypothetical protein
MTEALAGLDRDDLLAERAEAEAQLRAAEATLGIPPSPPNGHGDKTQEPDHPAKKSDKVNTQQAEAGPQIDLAELRSAAAACLVADDELAVAADEATQRPLPVEGQLGTAESAFARALDAREDLPAAWRRLVGALISATGMAIVVGALGWNVYWLLVPIALIAIMTVDLRVAGKAAREASVEAAQVLASVGVPGAENLDRIRSERARIEVAEARLVSARAARDAAYARFEALAPGRLPSEVDEIIADCEARQSAREAAEAEAAEAERVEAERHIEVEALEVEALEVEEALEAEPIDAERAPEPGPVASEPVVGPTPTATEWWFGSLEAPAAPPAASAPVRALAERLSTEGREALARIEAQLAALDRVELAKRSLEWHETNGSSEPAGDTPPEKP